MIRMTVRYVSLAWFLSASMAAQTLVTPTSKIQWTEVAPDLATAQSYLYRYTDDVTASEKFFDGVICSGTASPYVCVVPVPYFAQSGLHTIKLSACFPPVCFGPNQSAQSGVLSFIVPGPATPGTPVIIPDVVEPPPPPPPVSVTVTFNDLTPPDRPLTGQYPTGILDWGSDATRWQVSGPWRLFTTNSLTFSSSNASASVAVLGGWLESLRAFNGGSASATVTVTCPSSVAVNTPVAAGSVTTIATGWTAPCSPVTLAATNGYYTNFDDLVITK